MNIKFELHQMFGLGITAAWGDDAYGGIVIINLGPLLIAFTREPL
jgi:hypothetical protein